jgi:hypothetical protein
VCCCHYLMITWAIRCVALMWLWLMVTCGRFKWQEEDPQEGIRQSHVVLLRSHLLKWKHGTQEMLKNRKQTWGMLPGVGRNDVWNWTYITRNAEVESIKSHTQSLKWWVKWWETAWGVWPASTHTAPQQEHSRLKSVGKGLDATNLTWSV